MGNTLRFDPVINQETKEIEIEKSDTGLFVSSTDYDRKAQENELLMNTIKKLASRLEFSTNACIHRYNKYGSCAISWRDIRKNKELLDGIRRDTRNI